MDAPPFGAKGFARLKTKAIEIIGGVVLLSVGCGMFRVGAGLIAAGALLLLPSTVRLLRAKT